MTDISKQIAVIGAGYTGLAAAYDLARAGYKVTILEKDSEIGGLAGTFEPLPSYRIEKFYHHWFSSDLDVLEFIDELGLSSEVNFLPSNTGFYFANSIFRLSSPLDLLRFKPLPFIDRLRTGLMALRARRITDWHSLENQSAEDWIIRYAGKTSYDIIWGPLLQGKFGSEASKVSAVWFWNKLKLRGGSRDAKGAESLAYYRGSFAALNDAIHQKLLELGVTIRTSTEISQIRTTNSNRVEIHSPTGIEEYGQTLVTTPLPDFLRLCPELPKDYVKLHSKIRFLGNTCLILRLKQSLSDTYWLNVADPSFPFVGIIEHTNFDTQGNYAGEHIAYISKYLATESEIFRMSAEEFFEYSLPYIKQIVPRFNRDWVIGYHLWRANYSQPVVSKGYSKLIPEEETPIANLWLSTMAQIYPEDRGTNYAIRHGRNTAKLIIERNS